MKIENGNEKFYADLKKLTNSVVAIGYDAANNSNYGANYKFATIGAILKVVKPILNDCNFSLLQPLVELESGLHINTILLHTSGGCIESTVKVTAIDSTTKKGNKALSAPQELGVSITYMRRYALSSLLSIATEDDTDATISDQGQAPRQATKKQYKQPVQQQKPSLGGGPAPRTDQQNKMMRALFAKTNLTAEDMRTYLFDKYSAESSKDLNTVEMSEFIKYLEKKVV